MTMRSSVFKWGFGLCLVAFVFCVLPARAAAGEVKFEAILVWGTNDDKSPDPNHKPVSEAMKKRLKNFKWTHYFEVARKEFKVGKDEKKVEMSKDCVVIIKSLGDDQFEVSLIGKGKVVGTIKQKLHKDKCVVTGGDASNSTGWFVVIKRVE